MKKIEFNSKIAIFAFRYAINRKSNAPCIIVDYLIKHWNMFKSWEQNQMQIEINNEFNTLSFFDKHACEWNKILKLKVKKKT